MLLCTELERQRNKKQFCFETAWLRHPDFLVKVKETWEKPVIARNAADKWCIKLNRIKKVLKGWGANVKGHTKKYKIILQGQLHNIEKLEEDDILPAILLDGKTFIQAELLRLLEEEELY
jgi:hypothetical protein